MCCQWCGHCKSLKNTWSELAKKVRDERVPISIAAMDATVHTSTAKRFDIRGFPRLVFFLTTTNSATNAKETAAVHDRVESHSRPRCDVMRCVI